MHHPRGTDTPGQGGGVGITSIKPQTVCTIPRGTDIPGQGGGVGITSIKIQTVCSIPVVLISPVRVVVLVTAIKIQTVCIIPVVLISPVRVVVLELLYKDTDRMHHPRGTDIPGQGGGVVSLLSRYRPSA